MAEQITVEVMKGGVCQCGAFGAYGTTPPDTKPAVAGSRGANAALASLLTALASLGLITDGSVA